MEKRTPTCPSCGTRTGGNKATTVIIVIAVIGGLFFISIPVIGIVAAIAIPNFVAAQQKAKVANTKANMRLAQIAAESYAADFGGVFPVSVDSKFKSYYPGGVAKESEGTAPRNPFSNENEWPVSGRIQNIQNARAEDPGPISPGAVEYSAILDAQGKATNYAIRGGDGKGMTILDQQKNPLILSNQ